MSYNLSACVFIRNCFDGAFCLFESIMQLRPLVDEFIVVDLGSTDGTYEVLYDIAKCEPNHFKFRLITDEFPEIDAGAFATLANRIMRYCTYDNILYYQADEIWHEDLIELMKQRFDRGEFDLSFWRIQYRENFQKVKWFPHIVHRVGQKGSFNFVGDGMNTDRYMDAKICSNYGGEYFPRWGDEYKDKPSELPTNEMILDVSLVGAFLENIPERRRMHAPFWHEEPDIEGKPISEWMRIERENFNWQKLTSPFDIPKIMEFHLGKQKYELRDELLQCLKENRAFEVEGWR